MSRWIAVQLDHGMGKNGRVLSAKAMTQLQTVHARDADYGYGWFVSNDPALGRMVDHGGTLFTYSANVAVLPDADAGFAVMFTDVTRTGAEQQSFSDGLTAILSGEHP